MQGAINSIHAVQAYFMAQEAPFWTLSYYSTSSSTGQGLVVARNTKHNDLGESWQMLKQSIEQQTGSGRAQLHLIVYEKASGANTPSGRTNIDIVGGPQSSAVAGIGQLPSGYVDEAKIQSMMDEREKFWRLERENEDLRAQMEAPGDFWDKAISGLERVAATPLGMALVSKIMGGTIPVMPQAPVNGPYQPANEGDTEDVEDELEDLETIANSHGLSLKELLAKTAKMAKQQPEMVSILAAQ